MPSDSNHRFFDQNKAQGRFLLVFPRSEGEIFRDVAVLGSSARRHSMSWHRPKRGIKTAGSL
jgi:hypothetical protein